MIPSKHQFVGKKVKLGELCEIYSGGTPKRSVSEYWTGGNVPWVKIGDITEKYVSSTEECITQAGLNNSSAKLFKPGTLLYSIFASIGAVGILNILAATNQAIAGLVIRDNSLDHDFLYHYLKSREVASKTSGRGAAQSNINLTILRNMQVPVPPLVVQKEIVQNLEIVSRQLKMAKLQLSKLDSLVKSRFIEMFGDPCDANENRPKVTVSSVCELRIGPFGSSLHKDDYISGGHPLINPSHIIGNSIIPDMALTVSNDKYKSLEAYHLLPGDIVLGRRGEIGRCAVVRDKGLLCGTGSMILRPRAGVRSEYLQRVVSFPSFRQALERNAVGVTMKNLNARIVGAANIYLPSINQQDDLISFAKQVEKSRFAGTFTGTINVKNYAISCSVHNNSGRIPNEALHSAREVTECALFELQELYDSLTQKYFAL
jgi:type I restriction enzyme S subunit